MKDRTTDWALVSGASSGIGSALARALSLAGVGVVLNGRDTDRLEAVAADCRRNSAACVLMADLASSDERAQLLQGLAGHLEGQPGDLRYMVHCAGIGSPYERLESLDTGALERAFSVNVTAALGLTLGVMPMMRSAGRILLVGAGIADRPQPGTGIYGITKLALARLFQQLVTDLEYGADADAPALALFQPGLVDTPGLRDHVDAARRCRLPHADWLEQRLRQGAALPATEAAKAMEHALLHLEHHRFHGQTLDARTLIRS